MREIKFRAWDKELKNLGEVYGFDKYKIFASFDRDTDEDAMYELSRNNNVVLMQYTGLLDKQGVEIYEGDILEVDYEVNDVSIRFEATIPDIYMERTEDVCAVIGNIYENPELLP